MNEELKRYRRTATLFPSEASLLRLVSALTAEISEEWETARAYFAMRDELTLMASPIFELVVGTDRVLSEAKGEAEAANRSDSA